MAAVDEPAERPSGLASKVGAGCVVALGAGVSILVLLWIVWILATAFSLPECTSYDSRIVTWTRWQTVLLVLFGISLGVGGIAHTSGGGPWRRAVWALGGTAVFIAVVASSMWFSDYAFDRAGWNEDAAHCM